jgi:hypothetical protein
VLVIAAHRPEDPHGVIAQLRRPRGEGARGEGVRELGVIALGAPAGALDVERARVEALLRHGRLDEALPAAERLLAQLGVRLPLATDASRLRLAPRVPRAELRGLDFSERDAADVPPDRLLAIDVLASTASGLALTDPALGRAAQAELLRAALDAGEPVRVCRALAQEVCYAAADGSRGRVAVEAIGARLKELAMRLGHPQLDGFADVALGVGAHLAGRWRPARGHLEAGLAALRRHGDGGRWEIDVGDAFWLSTLFYVGEWREMARMTQLLLADAIERADPLAQHRLRTGRRNLAWLVAGRPADARAQLAIAERALAETARGVPGAFLWPHAQIVTAAIDIELYTGDGAAAARRLAEARGDLERLGCLRLQQPRVELAMLRARTALATLPQNASEERLRSIRAIGRELIDEGAGWAAALGHLVYASAHAFGRDASRARSELLAAEELLVGSGMMGLLQIARLRRGLVEGGASGAARAEAARDVMRELGAVEPERLAMHLVPWPS